MQNADKSYPGTPGVSGGFFPAVNIPLLRCVLKIVNYRLKTQERRRYTTMELFEVGGDYTDYAFRYMQRFEVAANDGKFLYLQDRFHLLAFKKHVEEELKIRKRECRFRSLEVHLGFAGFFVALLSLLFSFKTVSVCDKTISFLTLL